MQTKTSGAKAVRWFGSTILSKAALKQYPNYLPIKFAANALGREHPEFSVSPQHKVFHQINSAAHPDLDEVLIPAKHLVNGTSVVVDSNCKRVEYFHMMFDEHQLVFADGVWSESFFPGSYAISALDKNTRHEIEFLFPDLQADDPEKSYGELGYHKLKKKDAQIIFHDGASRGIYQ